MVFVKTIKRKRRIKNDMKGENIKSMAVKRTARILVTLECKKNCSSCCTRYYIKNYPVKQLKINDLKMFNQFDEVCITGGEPMLNPDALKRFITLIRKVNPTIKIYLYTALLNNDVFGILPELNGITYTIHYDERRIDTIELYNEFWSTLHDINPKISIRLYLDSRMPHGITILPKFINEVKILVWDHDGKCLPPKHEQVFFFDYLEVEHD